MPILNRTHPSSTRSSSARESFDLPDYYRDTRLETYGPYYRSPPPVLDLMETIDLRGRENVGFGSGFLLTDILEEGEEAQLGNPDLEVGFENQAVEPTRGKAEGKDGGRQRGNPWFWRIMSIVLRKHRGRKAHAVNEGFPSACPGGLVAA